MGGRPRTPSARRSRRRPALAADRAARVVLVRRAGPLRSPPPFRTEELLSGLEHVVVLPARFAARALRAARIGRVLGRMSFVEQPTLAGPSIQSANATARSASQVLPLPRIVVPHSGVRFVGRPAPGSQASGALVERLCRATTAKAPSSCRCPIRATRTSSITGVKWVRSLVLPPETVKARGRRRRRPGEFLLVRLLTHGAADEWGRTAGVSRAVALGGRGFGSVP